MTGVGSDRSKPSRRAQRKRSFDRGPREAAKLTLRTGKRIHLGVVRNKMSVKNVRGRRRFHVTAVRKRGKGVNTM